MVSLKKLEARVARQSVLLDKLSNNIVRLNPKRVTVFGFKKEEGREYAHKWISRKEYNALKRDAIKGGLDFKNTFRGVPLPKGHEKPTMTGYKLEFKAALVIKNPSEFWRTIGVKKKSIPKNVRVITYTKQQLQYVQMLRKLKKIPVTDITTQRVISNLSKPLTKAGLAIRITDVTP